MEGLSARHARNSCVQAEGTIEGSTINRSEYGAKSGERYEAVRPKDSDVLKGDGTFTSITQHSHDYQVGRGERYDPVKHGESELWKVTTLR